VITEDKRIFLHGASVMDRDAGNVFWSIK